MSSPRSHPVLLPERQDGGAPSKIARGLLLAAHFVCPLIFFTDLTRNPYITQIAMLHVGLLIAGGLTLAGLSLEGELRLSRTPLDLPIAAWIAVCALSWTLAYVGHPPFFRPTMRAEGFRVFYFTLVNCVLVYYLAVHHARECPEEPGVPVGGWALFTLLWGASWLLFPQMRAPAGPVTVLWAHVWDPYGALVWAAGIGGVLWIGRSGGAHAFMHAALSVGFLAATYGIAQYFGREFLWPKILNPYGGRSVSTFGNPNFMSSYLVMVLPLAVAYYLMAKSRAQRVVYAVCLLAMEAGLLSSLTRSSWVGALAAVAPLALSRRLRRLLGQDREFHGLVVTLAVLMAMFWPQSNVSGYVASVVGRLTEVAQVFQAEGDGYSPFFQRVLIWTCAWTMGAENPLLGKGWGLFELFYPFYQGHFLDHFKLFHTMRTHANNAHNELIEVWAQTGVLGVGVVLWTWAVFFRTAWAARGGRPPPDAPAKGGKGRGKSKPSAGWDDGERVWVLAAGAGVLGMLVDNLLNVSLHFAVPAFMFWWLAGTAMGSLARREGWRRVVRLPGRPAAVLAAALAVGAGLWGSWQAVRVWYREVHYFMGFKLMRRRTPDDMRRAVAELTRAYRWHPREVNNNYELGNAYARSEQIEKAVWAYGEALKANAGYDEIYFNLATVQKAMGRREDARRNYLTSWAINPMSHSLYASLTQFLLESGNRPDQTMLIEVLEKALFYYPEDLNFLNNLGFLYSKRSQHAKAEKIYTRVLELEPDMAIAQRNLELSLKQSGNPAPEVLSRLAAFKSLKLRLEKNRYDEESLSLARRVAEWFPRSTRASFYLGNLELARGNVAAAEPLFRAVLRKEPRHIGALLNLAQLQMGQGRREEAAGTLKAVLSIDPKNAHARTLLKSMGVR